VISLVKTLTNMYRILSWTMFISLFMFSPSILVNKAVYKSNNLLPCCYFFIGNNIFHLYFITVKVYYKINE